MTKSFFFIIVLSGAFFTIFASQKCHSKNTASHNKSTVVQKSDEKHAVQTICPVMLGPVDRNVFVIWEGDSVHTPKKLYFGGKMCADMFKKNPYKYIAILDSLNQPMENVVVNETNNK